MVLRRLLRMMISRCVWRVSAVWGLKVSRLPECRAFRAMPTGERLDDWLGCAETLIRGHVLRANKELDLLPQLSAFVPRQQRGRTGLLHSFSHHSPCALVCAAVWGVFLQMNSSLSHRTGDINDWLNDPTVIEQYNEAAEKQQRNDNLVQGLQQVRNLTDALATYPQVDSALMSKIGAAGGAQVSMVLTGYDAAYRRAAVRCTAAALSTFRAMCSSCRKPACSARWTTPAIPMRTACTSSA